uniref:Uncharacterized protein n=1 Tax=Lepeophtheirus salmonis TaxID=72036 RepID=A0A0K2TWI1_LEPSM
MSYILEYTCRAMLPRVRVWLSLSVCIVSYGDPIISYNMKLDNYVVG